MARLLAALGFLAVSALFAGCGGSERGARGSGTIEMDEVDVASLVGGRVTRIAVQEGDSVHAGDTLAVLDQGEVAASVEMRRAEAERAAALWRDVRAGPRTPEIKAAEAEEQSAEAAA